MIVTHVCQVPVSVQILVMSVTQVQKITKNEDNLLYQLIGCCFPLLACPPPPVVPEISISGTIDCITSFSGNTLAAQINTALPSCDGTEFNESPTLWIEFRDENTDFTSVSFDTCTSDFDTEVAVFQVLKNSFLFQKSKHFIVLFYVL